MIILLLISVLVSLLALLAQNLEHVFKSIKQAPHSLKEQPPPQKKATHKHKSLRRLKYDRSSDKVKKFA